MRIMILKNEIFFTGENIRSGVYAEKIQALRKLFNSFLCGKNIWQTKLPKENKVQVSDTTMMPKEQMMDNKFFCK